MKLPSDETPDPANSDGYLSDEFDQLEMMPAPIRDGDFSEYEWMEHEEEFNSQVLRELEEEELMEQCIVAMLDDEESEIQGNGTVTTNNARNTNDNVNSSSSVNGLSESVNNMSISANGVRSNPPSDNSNNSNSTSVNRPARFSVQNRLQSLRAPTNHTAESNGNEPKESTLNPDAKEFVPLSQNTTTSTTISASENSNVPS